MRLIADHPCGYCGVLVYTTIDERWYGLRTVTVARTLDAATARPHECSARSPTVLPYPEPMRCRDCRLPVYRLHDALYDDATALGRHVCAAVDVAAVTAAAPETAPTAAMSTTAITEPIPTPPEGRGRATRGQIGEIRRLRLALGITDERDLPTDLSYHQAVIYIQQLGALGHAQIDRRRGA